MLPFKYWAIRGLFVVFLAILIFLLASFLPARAEDTADTAPSSPDVICEDIYGNPYCVFLSMAMEAIGMGATTPTATPTITLTPTATRTPRPTSSPTVTPTLSPTPTELPGKVRFFGKPDEMLKLCIEIACRWYLRFVPANSNTCLNPVVDEVKSTYLGQSFNTFPPGQTPVITLEHIEAAFSQWKVDVEFIMFQYPFPPNAERYHLEIVCDRPQEVYVAALDERSFER